MNELRTEPVVSGRTYTVDEVDGRAPHDLHDFTGETFFRIVHGEEVHEITGVGRLLDGAVRFHQKAGSSGGKDLRVWSIHRSARGFEAEHAAP